MSKRCVEVQILKTLDKSLQAPNSGNDMSAVGALEQLRNDSSLCEGCGGIQYQHRPQGLSLGPRPRLQKHRPPHPYPHANRVQGYGQGHGQRVMNTPNEVCASSTLVLVIVVQNSCALRSQDLVVRITVAKLGLL